jgi:uncharacterized protein DUF5320
MPRGDKTGPEGRGPLTGKRMGNCAGDETSKFSNTFGFGRGFGRGFQNKHNRSGNRFFGRGQSSYQNPNFSEVKDSTTIENEINALKNQISSLEKKLSDLKD